MNKPRSQSKINSLPKDKRAVVETWLFDERISYTEARARLLEKFEVSIAISSLCEWYQKTAKERVMESLMARAVDKSESKQHDAAKRCFERFALLGLIMEHQQSDPAEAIKNIEFVLFHAPPELLKQAEAFA